MIEVQPNTLQRTYNNRWRLSHPAAAPGGACFAVVASWCGHCKNLKRNVADAQNYSPFDFFYMDGDQSDANRKKTQEMGVEGFPTIYYVGKDGFLEPHEGPTDAQSLSRKFHKGYNKYSGGSGSIFSWFR